jgi:hypothetical protein
MIILRGNSPQVETLLWNETRVWTTGVTTPWSVVQTYAGVIVMVTNDPYVLRNDMTGIYTITDNHTVAADVVHRGGFCLNCGFAEGMWRLRALVTAPSACHTACV